MLRAVFLLGVVFGSAACASPSWKQPPHDVRFQSAPPPRPHPPPPPTLPTDWWYTLEQTTVRPLGEVLAPIHWIDRATGGPLAHDINLFGEVLDSTWFTNRIGRRRMTVEEVARGPNTLDGPAPGPLRVESGKLAGASPGLLVEDAEGVRFLLKFDPPAYPGLASGAEVITTKILHAAGYNVPENYVVRFHPDRLELTPTAVGPGRHGEPVPLTPQKLEDLIMLANPTIEGTVQALFSRIVDGTPVGPFAYAGTRPDDPNDEIPHERRRSLRGYRWFCAWTNNTDTRASNTLDFFRSTEPGGQGHLVHYLIDFGNALGSLGTKPKYQSDGYEPILSWPVLFELFLTAGIRYRYWLPVERSPYRSVGTFEAEVFDPRRWSPSIPNPAFDDSTPLDDYWAASLIARFTPEMVRAIVERAQYRNADAAAYVVEVLLGRQEKILRMAFDRVAPLDDVGVTGSTARFTDLGVSAGLERGRTIRYRFRLTAADRGAPLAEGTTTIPHFSLASVLERRFDPAHPFFTLEARRVVDGRPGPAVRLHMRRVRDRLYPVALERDVD